MEVNRQSEQAEPESGPRLLLKGVARRLFAERGIHNVSVRDIAREAEQKNLGVVAYYFGTKEKLVQEILVDGASRIEALRHAYLDRLEQGGHALSLAQAVESIVIPSARFADEDEQYGNAFNRYLLQVSLTSSDLIDRTLAGRWNSAYQRCLAHMRGHLTHLTAQEQNRRFVFMGSYITSILAQREAMMADTAQLHETWRSEATLEDLIRTSAVLLAAPIR